MSINCFLALRLLTQYPVSYFLDIKEKLQEEENLKVSLKPYDRHREGEAFIFYPHVSLLSVLHVCFTSAQQTTDNKDVYDPSDFMRLYQLVCHSQHRTPEDLFHRCVMIAFLMKALKKTKYFDGKGTSSGEWH